MGKPLKHPDPVVVPDADDMDDATFCKHLEKRHAHEVHMSPDGTLTRYAMEAWINNFRTFHERLHDIAVPGQHDHEHEDYL